ncbi:MAG: TAXI family TRAP transporter solute-binding subunit [Oscillospiraceae bacterium]
MKKIAALLLAVCMTLTLSACGSGSTTTESTAPESSAPETTSPEAEQTSGVSSDWMGADLNGVAGAVGGGWYSTFAAFTELLQEKEPLLSFKVSPGSGIGNSATIGEGTFDIGWVYPPMCQLAYEGEEPYDQAYDGIRLIATGLSPQVIEVVARADVDVTSIDDIFNNKEGIRWLTPNKGSTTPALFFDIMLKYYGVTEDDIKSWGGSTTYTPYSDWSQLVQDGHVDIMFNQGSMPFSTTQEIAANTDLKLLPLPEDLINYMASNYALTEYTIPAGTYNFQDSDIDTLQMSSGLGCSAALDDDTVYRILEIIEANIDEFKEISPSFKNFDLTTAWQNTGSVPLHPGAEKFYKDHGYMS